MSLNECPPWGSHGDMTWEASGKLTWSYSLKKMNLYFRWPPPHYLYPAYHLNLYIHTYKHTNTKKIKITTTYDWTKKYHHHITQSAIQQVGCPIDASSMNVHRGVPMGTGLEGHLGNQPETTIKYHIFQTFTNHPNIHQPCIYSLSHHWSS